MTKANLICTFIEKTFWAVWWDLVESDEPLDDAAAATALYSRYRTAALDADCMAGFETVADLS